jgi:hypothetical protein
MSLMKKSRRRRLEAQLREAVLRLGEFHLAIPPVAGMVDAPAERLQHQIASLEKLLKKYDAADTKS